MQLRYHNYIIIIFSNKKILLLSLQIRLLQPSWCTFTNKVDVFIYEFILLVFMKVRGFYLDSNEMNIFGCCPNINIFFFPVIFKVYDSDCNGKVSFNDILEVLRDMSGSFMSDEQREVKPKFNQFSFSVSVCVCVIKLKDKG